MKIFSSYIYGDFLSNLYNIMKKKIIFKGEYLCKKGDKFDKLFIIINGNFQVYFNSLVKMKTIYDLSSFDKNKAISRGSAYNMNFELKNYYNEKYEYKIVEYGKGQIIGDIEYTNHTDKYLFSIICEVDNSQILEIPFFELYKLSTRELKEQIRFVTNEKIKLYIKRIEEIKNVNLKMQNRQNQYKNLILLKIQKSKGKILEKLDKKEKVLKYNNKKLKLILTKNKNSPDKNIQNMDYFPTNHSNKYNKKPLFFEFHKISHNNSSSKLIEKKNFFKT